MVRSNSRGDEWALPLFWIVGAMTAIVACFWFLLFDLSQPTAYPNPGLAAHTPPPGTRLIPLLRRSDAPKLADVPNEPASPLTALAQAPSNQKGVPELPPRNRPRVAASQDDQQKSDYGQQWNNGSSAGSSNRAWSGPRKMSGGPKSSF
jgi:hypothetical protein